MKKGSSEEAVKADEAALERLQKEAAETGEQTEVGASVERVEVALQEMLQICVGERLTASQQVK